MVVYSTVSWSEYAAITRLFSKLNETKSSRLIWLPKFEVYTDFHVSSMPEVLRTQMKIQYFLLVMAITVVFLTSLFEWHKNTKTSTIMFADDI